MIFSLRKADAFRLESNERIRLKSVFGFGLVYYKGRVNGRVAPAKGPIFHAVHESNRDNNTMEQNNNATKYLFYEDFETEAVLLRFSSSEILVE